MIQRSVDGHSRLEPLEERLAGFGNLGLRVFHVVFPSG